jgi:hypothetical protein
MTGRGLRFVAVATMVVGFASAIWIYLNAASSAGDTLGYNPEETKQYLRAMELYGGKANVMAAELRQWFASLWHGTRLAYTVACATTLLAGVFWFTSAAVEE